MEGLRRRGLSLLEVLAQSVSVLAPSAATVTVPAIVFGQAGGLTLPALLAAFALILLVGWCLTHSARRMAAVGGVYSYTAKGLGSGGALLAGWGLGIGYAAVAVGALLGSALYLASALDMAGSRPAVAAVVSVVGAAATTLTIRGIQLSARVALSLEVLSSVLVLLVLSLLLVRQQPAPTAVDPVVHWHGAAVGVVLWVTGFMGFESAATLGVEARRPLTSIPRAVLWTPVAAGTLFLVAAAEQVALLRRSPLDVLTSPVPVAALADRARLDWLPVALDLGVAASFFAAVTGATNALARLLFSMARERVLPEVLGRTHRRFKTPHVALAVVLPLVVSIPVVALSAGREPRDVLVDALTVSAFGYLVAYVLACFAMPAFLRRIGELTPAAHAAGLAAGGSWVLVLVAAVAGGSWSGGRTPALVFLASLIPAVGWWSLLRWRAPSRLRQVGAYDQTTTQEVLPGAWGRSAAWAGRRSA